MSDVVLAICLGALGAFVSLKLSGALPLEVLQKDALDIWFDSDPYDASQDWLSRFSGIKSQSHPLFSAAGWPAARFFTALLGAEPHIAIGRVLAVYAGLWSASLFALMRILRLPRFESILLCLLGLSSATFVFFSAIPETFMLGSLTIVLALMWAAADLRGRASALGEAVVSAATLSISVTNWMVGGISSLIRRPLREAAQITVNALAVVTVLWALQKRVFPSSQFFAAGSYDGERSSFVFAPEAGGFVSNFASFVWHSMVMPAMHVVNRPGTGRWHLLSVQHGGLFTSGLVGTLATVFWSLLLIVGLAGAFSQRTPARIRWIVLASLVGQLLLHSIFGYEMFLYSFHWLPLLLCVAAFGATAVRTRVPFLLLAGACIAASGTNNVLQFRVATDFVEGQRQVIAERIRYDSLGPKSTMPWPDSIARWPATSGRHFDAAASDYSVFGTLWPSFDSFHLGILVTDSAGDVVASSYVNDGHVLGSGRRFDDAGRMVLETQSRFYTATWTWIEPRVWSLRLTVNGVEGSRIWIVARAVGWEFGRILAASRDDVGATINGRWRLTTDPPANITLGTEPSAQLLTPALSADSIQSPAGLGFLRFGPIATGELLVRVEDVDRHRGVDLILGTISQQGNTAHWPRTRRKPVP